MASSTNPASSVRFPCGVCGGGEIAAEELSGFVLKSHFSLQSVCIQEFKCVDSGLTVFLCGTQSPLSHLFISLKTETHTHEGLPHTLEHLVFLGSQHYPYKGFLDLVASRGFSQGTNAWTATDHTTYTLSTAGSEGMLNLLPIYLDHILLPTLSDDAFLTEVHHFRADGTSAGVVYSEMEARERTADSRCGLKLSERLYPGDSGYKYETGGLLRSIRATSNSRVRAYHRLFYSLDNMAIIVVGRVGRRPLLSRLRESILKIQSALRAREAAPSQARDALRSAPAPAGSSWVEDQDSDFSKPLAFGETPWSLEQNVAALRESTADVVTFPSDDEKFGQVALGFRGPAWKELLQREAISVLGSYYTESNVALLQKELVHSPSPVCSSIHFQTEAFKETAVLLEAHDVPLEPAMEEKGSGESPLLKNPSAWQKGASSETAEKGAAASARGWEVLSRVKKLLEEETTADAHLNLQRLHSIIRRELQQYYEALETEPHEILVEALNEYFLYGEGDTALLAASLDQGALAAALLQRDESFWKSLLQRVFVDAFHAGVVACPSKAEALELEKKDKEAAAAVLQKVGKEALKELADRVEVIKKQQTQQPPAEAVQAVPLARLEDVSLLKVATVENFSLAPWNACSSARDVRVWTEPSSEGEERDCETLAAVRGRLQALPFFALVSHIDSQFVGMRLCLRLPPDCTVSEKQLLLVLADLLFESDVKIPKTHAALLFAKSGEPLEGAATSDAKEECVVLSHESFTKLLMGISTSYRAGMSFSADSGPGVCSANSSSSILSIRATAPKENASALAAALQAAAVGLVLTRERVEVVLKKHLKQLARRMRKGEYLLQQMSHGLWFRREAFSSCGNAGQQRHRVRQLLERPDAAVEELQLLYRRLVNPERAFLHVVGNATEFSPLTPARVDGPGEEDCLSLWKNFPQSRQSASAKESSAPLPACLLPPPAKGLELLANEVTSLAKAKKAPALRLACGLSSGGASYLQASIQAPRGYYHKEVAALFVMCECLSMVEGTLYRVVRGAGHAYGCDFAYSPWAGRLSLTLAPATDVVAAFQASLEAFRGVVEKEPLSNQDIEAAKCGVLFSVVREEGTLVDAAVTGAALLLENLPLDFNARLLKEVAAVTPEEVKRLASKYLTQFLQCFGSAQENGECFSTLSVVTRTEKVKETLERLEGLGVSKVAVVSPRQLREFLCLDQDSQVAAFFKDEAHYDAERAFNADASENQEEDSEEGSEEGFESEDEEESEDEDDSQDEDESGSD